MSLVKLSLASLTVAEKLQFARLVAGKLEQFAEIFPEPPRSIDEIRDTADLLQGMYNNAQIARQDAMEKTTLQDNAADLMDAMLTQTANYVQSVSGGDASVIELAGMNVRNPNRRVGHLPAPANFAAVAEQNGGRITLRWEKLHGARIYVADHTTDLAGSWTRAGAVTRTKLALEGLTSAARYWFRVAAVGAAGQGAWSEALSKVAP